MNTAIFYDTETTGLPLYREPSGDLRQPHIVQLAAMLVDLNTRKTISSMNVIVRPTDWVISEEVAAIHGITTEKAMDVGVPEVVALEMFMNLWSGRTRAGHNEAFDARIIRIAQHRFGHPEAKLAAWKDSPAQCTARAATPIVKCPPTAKMRAVGRFHYKTPTLAEAHQHLLGRPLENAHSAMADVEGCLAVYFAIQDLEKESEIANA
ncbi:MAG: 3'-5' exonuclease [Porticoccaceae bacterium]